MIGVPLFFSIKLSRDLGSGAFYIEDWTAAMRAELSILAYFSSTIRTYEESHREGPPLEYSKELWRRGQ